MIRRQVVSAVIHQHAGDAAFLYGVRTRLTTARHIRLTELSRFDDRLAAHLDGLVIAGEHARRLCDAALDTPTPGAVFTATVVAIENNAAEWLKCLYSLAEAVPETQPGLVAAFGWVEQHHLRGTVAELLAASSAFSRLTGMGICALHRVDPGRIRDNFLESTDLPLRARVLRAFGEVGIRDRLPACLRALSIEDPEGRFWGAWSAVLLGNRGVALESLTLLSGIPQRLRLRALQLALQAMEQESSHVLLRQLAHVPQNWRWLIQGSGIVGDPTYVPWIIKHMTGAKTARLAGEAFSLITGLDLAKSHLEGEPQPVGAGTPNDDPEDPIVSIDEDDGLPWPDPERISDWWQANKSRFTPGTRYFFGAPVTRESCIKVLKEGFQRQRILASHYLCLLEPGTTLFEWRAPSPRQQRLLAGMA